MGALKAIRSAKTLNEIVQKFSLHPFFKSDNGKGIYKSEHQSFLKSRKTQKLLIIQSFLTIFIRK